MKPITQPEIVEYVEANIPQFHQNRLEKLKTLTLESVLRGNSSQIRKMRDNFSKAKKILGTNVYHRTNVVAVKGVYASLL